MSIYGLPNPNVNSDLELLGTLGGPWQAWDFVGKIDGEFIATLNAFKQFINEGLRFIHADRFYIGMFGTVKQNARPTIVAMCFTKQTRLSLGELKKLYEDFPNWTTRYDRYQVPHIAGFMILVLHGDISGFSLDEAPPTPLEHLTPGVMRAWQGYSSSKKSQIITSQLESPRTSNQQPRTVDPQPQQPNPHTGQESEQSVSEGLQDRTTSSHHEKDANREQRKILHPPINPPNYFPKVFSPITHTSRYKKLFRPRIWPLPLDPDSQREWQYIKTRIELLVCRTPASSKGKSTPIVIIQGFVVGPTERLRFPTVLICSNSLHYAYELQKAIEKNSILDGKNFRTLIADGPVNTGQIETTGLPKAGDNNISGSYFAEIMDIWLDRPRRKRSDEELGSLEQ